MNNTADSKAFDIFASDLFDLASYGGPHPLLDPDELRLGRDGGGTSRENAVVMSRSTANHNGRYRGNGMLIVGVEGSGKSSLAFQAALNHVNGNILWQREALYPSSSSAAVPGGGEAGSGGQPHQRVLILCHRASVTRKPPKPQCALEEIDERALQLIQYKYCHTLKDVRRHLAEACSGRGGGGGDVAPPQQQQPAPSTGMIIVEDDLLEVLSTAAGTGGGSAGTNSGPGGGSGGGGGSLLATSSVAVGNGETKNEYCKTLALLEYTIEHLRCVQGQGQHHPLPYYIFVSNAHIPGMTNIPPSTRAPGASAVGGHAKIPNELPFAIPSVVVHVDQHHHQQQQQPSYPNHHGSVQQGAVPPLLGSTGTVGHGQRYTATVIQHDHALSHSSFFALTLASTGSSTGSSRRFLLEEEGESTGSGLPTGGGGEQQQQTACTTTVGGCSKTIAQALYSLGSEQMKVQELRFHHGM